MGVSKNRGPYGTLNSRILIIRSQNQVPVILNSSSMDAPKRFTSPCRASPSTWSLPQDLNSSIASAQAMRNVPLPRAYAGLSVSSSGCYDFGRTPTLLLAFGNIYDPWNQTGARDDVGFWIHGFRQLWVRDVSLLRISHPAPRRNDLLVSFDPNCFP